MQQQILTLSEKPIFSLKIFYEQKLGDNRNNAGVIFWLNNKENTRWSNEQEFKFSAESKAETTLPPTPEEIAARYGKILTDGEPLQLPDVPEVPD